MLLQVFENLRKIFGKLSETVQKEFENFLKIL